ncbi:hypothetical protein FRC07_004733 [Ceratobasidium sp. 392]|nr:hypothetical protein FRC07_004733 [Ceratobasidium sp. 392]
MASLGFAQWATGVRNRMANDPGRADFKDQVQCHGHLFLHEYLDDVLNAPRPENVIEFAKTPGRNKTASKRTRAANASAQKVKPIMPLSFSGEPVDKENISAPTPAAKQPQPKGNSRFQNALFTARETPIEDASHTRDSISRATFSRPGVPVFSPAAPTPARAPLDDPLSPFRDAESPEQAPPPVQQPQEKTITAQQLFTDKLIIQPSSPVAEPVEEPSPAVPPGLSLTSALTANTLAGSESQPTEADLSVIQEDDEGNSIAAFEDARSEFSRPATAHELEDDDEEVDITEIADKPPVLAAPVVQQEAPVVQTVKAASSPTAKAASVPVPVKAVSSPIERPVTPVQRLPSPPASEDTPPPSSKQGSPMKAAEPAPEPEPVKPATATAVLDVPPVSAPEPEPEPAPIAAPVITPVSTTSQPTPPPDPTPVVASAPPVASRNDSQNQTQPAQVQPQPAQVRPANPPRGLGGAFTGPSLKDLRREPSVSGATHREMRQSSWRKKPDSAAPNSVPAAPAEEPNRLKRKSSVLTKPGTSKHQRKHSSSSSHSLSSSDNEPTEMQVPIKDEDSTGGSGWGSGGSMLDDLRSRLARLEKSTSGKTPAANRTWGGSVASGSGTTPVLDSVGLPNIGGGDERRMSISDLGILPAPLGNKTLSTQDDDAVINPLALSTDAQESQRAANESILSNRTTTPENSPPPVRRVLPAPPVFAVPVEPAAPVTTKVSSDAVRAAAKAEAAKFFAGTKLAPAPSASRTETQSTVVTQMENVFDIQSQAQSQWSQSTTQTQSVLGTDAGDLIDLDELDVDADGEAEADEEAEEDTKASDGGSSLASSTTQTRSMAKKGPVKSIQLAAAAAKKAAEEQDRKMSRMKDMEERRQAAALRKAEEDKAKSSELEKKRKEREELAASKSVKPVVKKAQEDPNKKRKVEAEKKPAETKKPMGSTVFKDTAATKSRIAKPTPGPSASTSQAPQLKSAMKSTTNPFAPPPSSTKTLKHAGSSSSLKSTSGTIGKKAKASISDAPGQALQAQMHARVQAQLKAAQKEPEIQSENIELPDINSEYSDSDDEDRDKDFPDWAQSDELMQALKDQESYNPAAIFGPIPPLKMGDLFKTGHSRFRKRTSSANWAGTDGITIEEEIEYARRMGYKN